MIKNWICNCNSPLPDLISYKEKSCEVCKMEKPISGIYNMKSIVIKKLTSNAGKKRMSSLNKKQRRELSMKAVLAKKLKNK